MKWDDVRTTRDQDTKLQELLLFFQGDSFPNFPLDVFRWLSPEEVLVSKSLSPAVQSVDVVRKGLPLRATRYSGARFPGVGQNDPKASDHCPVVVELKI